MATLGETLKDQRERLGLSIEQAEQATRIRARLLVALENDDYEHLPDPGYVKGYVWSYAKFLELDPNETVDLYRKQVGTMHRHEVNLANEPVVLASREQHALPLRTALIVVAVIAVLALAVWGVARVVNPPDTTPPVPQPAETTPTPKPTPKPKPSTEPTASTETTTPSESAKPEKGPFKLTVTVTEGKRSWMRIRVDGDVVFENVLEGGQTKEYDVETEASLRLGAPTVVKVERDGFPVEIPTDSETPVVVIKADEVP